MNIDIERIRHHIETLARFTTTPGAGTTRLSYSPEYRAACDYLIDYATGLGLDARLDAIGNLRICHAGSDPSAKAVVVGSHLDSVIHGGDFDGILGVVAGLEVLEVLIHQGPRLRCPIEVVSFVEEEGTSFRCPLAGSKALTGAFSVNDLQALHNEAGESLFEVATRFGLRPMDLLREQFRPGTLTAMLELHIEQGAILEEQGLPVGIVARIAGSENYRITLEGRANHAGTTPMNLRLDAMAAAAEMMLAVEHIAAEPQRPETVGTIGRIHCIPNAVNVIPGRVEFSLDVRDVYQDRIESASTAMLQAMREIAQRRGIGFDAELTGKSSPVPCEPDLVGLLVRLAEQRDIPHLTMNSGALHDAALMTQVTAAGMIFVPSIEGRSHTPNERTHYADIQHGVTLLLAAVCELGK